VDLPILERDRSAEFTLRLLGSTVDDAVTEVATAQQFGNAHEIGPTVTVLQRLSETADDIDLVVGESKHDAMASWVR
jgi:hypothetical protein